MHDCTTQIEEVDMDPWSLLRTLIAVDRMSAFMPVP